MKKHLMKSFAFCLLGLGATNLSAQYCTTAGATSTFDSNVETTVLTGDAATSINYAGCTGTPATGLNDLTATQSVNVTAGNPYTADIQFGTCGDDYVGVGEAWIDWNQNENFDVNESIGTWSGTPPTTLSSFTFTVPVTAINGTTRMRVIQEEGGSLPLDPCQSFTYGSAADFSIVVSGGVAITCPSPTGLMASPILATSADLAWTETGTATSWAVEYGALGFAPGAGTTMFTGNNPLTITGLMPTTSYEFYVQAICGAGDSSTWAGPYAFVTPCVAATPTYSEDFSNFLNPCWSEARGVLSTSTTLTGTTSSWTTQFFGNTGSDFAARLNLYSNNRQEWITSQMIDLGTAATNYQLEFDIALTDYNTSNATTLGVDDTIAIVISTDYGVTWQMANVLQFWLPGSEPSNTGDHIIIDLSAYTGVVQFGFYAASSVGNADNDLFIDNFLITNLASCSAPNTLTAMNVMATSADLGWTETGTATSWAVEYGATGFAPGAGTTMLATTNPFSATGLMAATSYDFYVQAICGAGDSSIWVGPLTFTTPCAPVMAPYLEAFATNALPACWSEAGANSWEYGSTTTTPTGFAGHGAANVSDHSMGGGGNFIGMDGSNNGDTDVSTLMSPFVDITPLTNPELSYWVFSNNVNDAAQNKLIVEFYDGANWTVIDSIQSNLGSTWLEFTTDLSAFTVTGNTQVRFSVTGVSNGGFTFYNDILIDDVHFREMPSCPSPNALMVTNITATSADLAWTENGTATSWAVEYGATGFAPGAGTTMFVAANPFSATALMSATSYDFYVQAICGAGDSSQWVGPFTFATPCAVLSGDVSGDAILVGSLPYSTTGNTDSCYMDTRNNASADVWYQHIVEPCTDSLTISLCGSDFDTYVRVFASDANTQLFFNDDNSVACGTGGNSHLVIDVTNDSLINEGDTIFIMVEGFTTSQGMYDLNISSTIQCPVITDLVITEIMYNSPEGGTDSLEFVEIYNNGNADVDLTNYTLSGITYTFPAVTLPVGGYYVIGVNASAFNTVYGFAADGIATGGLSNSGEAVMISNAMGMVLDSVFYEDNAPWPTSPDGDGSSLILCDPASDNADGTNWSAATTSTGVIINGNLVLASPGAANACPAVLDVAVTSFYNLDSTYCNVPTITGSVIITNMDGVDVTNVPYTITANGAPIGAGTIALLAANASDTITVGPFPAATGAVNVVAMTSLVGDVNTSNDMLSMMVNISNTSATASVMTTISCNGDSTGAVMAVGTDGLGTYSYEWNADANLSTATLMNAAAGMHTVVVMDSIGCTDTAMVTLTEPTALVITTTDNGDGTAYATATGGTAGYTFLWDAAAGNQTTDTATTLVNGTYMVTVTDANGCSDTASVTVLIVGVNNIANLSNLNMFPNPANANVFVALELVENATVQINVTNSIGQLVISKELTNVQSETVELNTSTLTSGVYIVQFTIGTELVTRKLIVSKQ
ncbi:MAG: internalin, putative [uncultured Aureispira sp.]|uniref:Internalin, putative n=1 Tax=uncultured Aureispira sp. TaxID=1331704 RepID=A0A6S6U4H9_9BACT|nr:MAG: internalin, putative [uncultured Aureispira sp.]